MRYRRKVFRGRGRERARVLARCSDSGNRFRGVSYAPPCALRGPTVTRRRVARRGGRRRARITPGGAHRALCTPHPPRSTRVPRRAPRALRPPPARGEKGATSAGAAFRRSWFLRRRTLRRAHASTCAGARGAKPGRQGAGRAAVRGRGARVIKKFIYKQGEPARAEGVPPLGRAARAGWAERRPGSCVRCGAKDDAEIRTGGRNEPAAGRRGRPSKGGSPGVFAAVQYAPLWPCCGRFVRCAPLSTRTGHARPVSASHLTRNRHARWSPLPLI